MPLVETVRCRWVQRVGILEARPPALTAVEQAAGLRGSVPDPRRHARISNRIDAGARRGPRRAVSARAASSAVAIEEGEVEAGDRSETPSSPKSAIDSSASTRPDPASGKMSFGYVAALITLRLDEDAQPEPRRRKALFTGWRRRPARPRRHRRDRETPRTDAGVGTRLSSWLKTRCRGRLSTASW